MNEDHFAEQRRRIDEEEQRGVEEAWPGIGRFAREHAGPDCIIGFGDGRLRVWRRSAAPPLGALPAGRFEPPDGSPAREWVGRKSVIHENDDLAVYQEPEIASLCGMTRFWHRDTERWERPHRVVAAVSRRNEAEAITDFLFEEGFLKRPYGRSRPMRWRYGWAGLALNGPTEGDRGLWFHAALSATFWDTPPGANPQFNPDDRGIASLIHGVAVSTVKDVWDPAVWDWTRYRLDDGHLTPEPDSFLQSTDGPWPLWAREGVARHRLVQRAAELLFAANERRWQDNKARRQVLMPKSEEWQIISLLLTELASRATRLSFEPQSPARAYPDGTPALLLWAAIQGRAHLRRCAACGRWVLNYGPRPRRSCDATCRQRRRRGNP